MGFFDKLLSRMGENPRRPCPACGRDLWFDRDFGNRYECRNESCLGGGVYFDQGGALVDPHDPARRSSPGEGRDCVWCQESLSRGDDYAPYEDASDQHGYIICPSCQRKNPL